MKKFELSLSSKYVPEWGVLEGVRELFQNSLDQEIVDKTNIMFFDYNPENKTLKLGNLKSKLEIKTLLLGNTSKEDDSRTIGHFGEGYKVGTLALIRENKEVIFHNYGKRQVWLPRFVKSRRYGDEEILTFFIEDKGLWTPTPHNNLEIEVKGITKDEYDDLKKSNLHLDPPNNIIKTKKGDVILDEDKKNKIYVNGLFVEETSGFAYGYNIKPAFISLDRDRRSVGNFSLKQVTRDMWVEIKDDYPDEIVSMAKEDSNDIELLHYATIENDDTAFEEFKNTHGDNAIPTTHSDFEKDKRKFPNCELIPVSQTYKTLICASKSYDDISMVLEVEVKSISDELRDLIKCIEELHEKDLRITETERLETLIKRIKRIEYYE